MTDLLGPADAGAVNTLTTTSDVSHPAVGDTFFQDCTGGNPSTGSNLPSKFTNRLLQQARRIIRLSGIPLANGDDDMLGQAIQSGAMRWAGTFGGTANALTATLSPVAPGLTAGMRLFGIAGAANTGSATLNVNGLGAVALVDPNGFALPANYIAAGSVLGVVFDGTAFRVVSGSSAALSGAGGVFSTSTSSPQSLANNVITAVSPGTGTFTNVGAISAGTFVFSRPGLYFIRFQANFQITLSAATNWQAALFFDQNSVAAIATASQGYAPASGVYAPYVAVSDTVAAAVGDVIGVSAEASSTVGGAFTSAFVTTCSIAITILQ